jgi:hypothetical protein
MEVKTVPADLFCRFAAADLTRWRALAGCTVSPRDCRWGAGRVSDVRWEGRSDRPEDPGVIYLRVEYADGFRARVNARAFGRLHSDVTLETSLADFVLRWFGDSKRADGEDCTRAAALGACDAILRNRQDEERKRRAETLRKRSRERRGEGSL